MCGLWQRMPRGKKMNHKTERKGMPLAEVLGALPFQGGMYIGGKVFDLRGGQSLVPLASSGVLTAHGRTAGVTHGRAPFLSWLRLPVLVLVYKFLLLSWTLRENVNPSTHPLKFHPFLTSPYPLQPSWALSRAYSGAQWNLQSMGARPCPEA